MTPDRSRLLVATRNNGKLAELRELLSDLPIELVSLTDVNCRIEIDETGATFAENAVLKAAGYAQSAGLWALADDSGLEIAALGGRPGVLSARYGGDDLGFDRKMEMLLGELSNTDGTDRCARFVCSIAIADADGKILKRSDGICDGKIADRPRGAGGFGYDPIFIPDGYDETFGELSGAIKQKISHRKRAFCQIIPYLRDFIAF
jgi:XTP/dITP diphosphohydrolase